MDDKSRLMLTARLFEGYVRYVWPLHRRLVKHGYSARCPRCAASVHMTPFDAQGLCRDCSGGVAPMIEPQRLAQSRTATQALDDILATTRGTAQYDALILFSGGKDSCYMVRRIQQEHPHLRLLAYTMDNGFMSPVAKQNIDAVLARLNVDHLYVRPRQGFHAQLFRYCLTHLNAEGGYGTLDFSDGEFMLDTARRLAAERHIPLILCGYSRYQVQNGLQLHDFESPPKSECADRTHTAGLALTDIFSDPTDILAWWRGSQWPAQQVARLLFPLYAWDIEEESILEQVQTWGLVSAQSVSPIVTNHQLIMLIGVVDVHQLGYSSFEPEFCRMIREGKAQRRHWQHVFEFMEYTARTGRFIRPQVRLLLRSLELSEDQVGIQYNATTPTGSTACVPS